MSGKSKIRNRQAVPQGFTLLEVMIAAVIVTLVAIGLLGLFTQTVVSMKYAQDDLIARQKAREALEMVMSAKTTGQLNWTTPTDTLENVGTNQGVFLTGFQPMYQQCTTLNGSALTSTSPGYGLVGTCSDSGIDSYTIPGKNGNLTGAGSAVVPLSNFLRQISISPVVINGVTDSSLRLIQVSVEYPQLPAGYRVYIVSSYISSYR